MAKINCPGCNAEYQIPESVPFGRKLKCKRCDNAFVYQMQETEAPKSNDLPDWMAGDEIPPLADVPAVEPVPPPAPVFVPPPAPVPAAAPVPVQKPNSTPQSPPISLSKAKYGVGFSVCYVVIMVVLGFGAVSLLRTPPNIQSGLYLLERFKEDNAYGATANALERIQVLQERVQVLTETMHSNSILMVALLVILVADRWLHSMRRMA